jgi:hypothetical protein
MSLLFLERATSEVIGRENQMNLKNNLGREIRRHRMVFHISQTLAARKLDRSQRWLSLIESGQLPISEEKAKKIMAAISRIGQQVSASTAGVLDFSDLRFPARRPRSKPTSSRHQQPAHQETVFKKEVRTNSEAIQQIDEIAEVLRKKF